jgi:hypothetical protein
MRGRLTHRYLEIECLSLVCDWCQGKSREGEGQSWIRISDQTGRIETTVARKKYSGDRLFWGTSVNQTRHWGTGQGSLFWQSLSNTLLLHCRLLSLKRHQSRIECHHHMMHLSSAVLSFFPPRCCCSCMLTSTLFSFGLHRANNVLLGNFLSLTKFLSHLLAQTATASSAA